MAVVFDFESAGGRTDEIKHPFFFHLQFHQRGQVDRFAVGKFLQKHPGKFLQRGGDLGGLPGLTGGEVRGLQSARVVFVLGLAFLVGGLGVGGARGIHMQLHLGPQGIHDRIDQRFFIHAAM